AAVKAKNVDADEVLTLERRLDRVRTLSAKLQGDYNASRHHFTAHRYEDDARSYQEAAYLYDVYVLQSSARSDRHCQRRFGLIIGVRLRCEAVLRRDAEPLEELPRRGPQRREVDLRLPIGISKRLQNLLALLRVDRLLLAVRPAVGPVLVDQDRGGEQALIGV